MATAPLPQVHDCLRRSLEHLSPACRQAEEQVEALEHEDVRLNPKIQKWDTSLGLWGGSVGGEAGGRWPEPHGLNPKA